MTSTTQPSPLGLAARVAAEPISSKGGPLGQVVTVMNMKGGVGKTTLTLHLGSLIGLMRRTPRLRVLLIDLDPQFNLSQSLLEPKTYFELEKAGRTSLAIFQDDPTTVDPFTIPVLGKHEPPPLDAVVSTVFPNKVRGEKSHVDLVPSSLDLMYLTFGQTRERVEPYIERFVKFAAAAKQAYDLVFIDCHPAGSILTKSALVTSDHVIIPVVSERYAVRGVGLMHQLLRSLGSGKEPTPHVVFNRVSSGPMSGEEQQVRADARMGASCLKTRLRKFSAFSDTFAGAQFVWQSKKSWSGQAFANLYSLASELLVRFGIGGSK